MDLHHGSIYVYSEGMGHGCVFSIELPITLSEPLNLDNNNKTVIGTFSTTDNLLDNINNNNDHLNMNFNENDSIKLSPLQILNKKISDSSIIDTTEPQHVNAHIKALIVDDSSMNRKMVRRLLEMKGNYDSYDDVDEDDYNDDSFSSSNRNNAKECIINNTPLLI